MLALYPFASTRPLRYFDEANVGPLLALLTKFPHATLEALEAFHVEITHAIETLTTPSTSWAREDGIRLSNAEDYAAFEQIWHPEYQRYVEHAFNHLIQIPLRLLGRSAGKDFTSQALSLRVDRLRSLPDLAGLTNGYDSIVRNSIAHGSAGFTQFGVLYVDRKDRLELHPSEFADRFDSLVRAAHGLAVGIILFLLRNWTEVARFGKERLPLGLLYLASLGVATHRDFDVQRFVASELAGGKRQLNVVCTTSIVSRSFHQLCALHLLKNVEDLGGGRFDRAALSIHCGRRLPSSMFVDVAHLRRARAQALPVTELARAVEGSLLWHDSGELARRLATWRLVVRTVFAEHADKVVQEWRRQGLIVARSLYSPRIVENRSVGSIRRIEARVTLRDGVEPTLRDVRALTFHALRRLRRMRVPGIELGRDSRFLRRPSHVWLFVYREDDIRRRLSGGLINNSGVLAEAEWKARRSKSTFQLIREPHEIRARARIRFAAGLV